MHFELLPHSRALHRAVQRRAAAHSSARLDIVTLVCVRRGAARRRHVPRADGGGQAEQELLAERAAALTPEPRSRSLTARSRLHRSPPRSHSDPLHSSIRSFRPLRCDRLCPPERRPPPDRPHGRAASARDCIRLCRSSALRAWLRRARAQLGRGRHDAQRQAAAEHPRRARQRLRPLPPAGSAAGLSRACNLQRTPHTRSEGNGVALSRQPQAI